MPKGDTDYNKPSLLNPLPDMTILGSSNSNYSAANKDMMSKYGDTII